MPYGYEDSLFVQAPKPADTKTYVGDLATCYIKTKNGIAIDHRYPGMEVIENIGGVITKYTWDAVNETWRSLGTALYSNSNLTTTAVGNIPAGQNLSGKSWHEIIDSIFYSLSISTFEISLTNTNSYTSDYEWGTTYNSATIRFKFTVSGIHLSTLTLEGEQNSKISITSGGTTYALGSCTWSITENAFVGTITNFTQSSLTTYSKTLTLNVNKSTSGVVTKTNTVYFNRNIYYGRHLADITIDQYNHNTLIGEGFLFSVRRSNTAVYSSYVVEATAQPEDIYFFIPSDYTVTNIIDIDTQLNFPYTVSGVITFTYNHVAGTPTTSYKIYKSINKSAAKVTLKIL